MADSLRMAAVTGKGGARRRVLLADDHPMILDSLARLLESEFDIVGRASSGAEALDLGLGLRPDLAILDIAMPGLDGTEIARRLLAELPGLKVLMLSLHHQAHWVRNAFAAGAAGYLCKTAAPAEILLAVQEVLAGRCWVSPAVAKNALQPRPQRPREQEETPPPADEPGKANPGLTAREAEIVELLSLSLGNKEIARHLKVSVATVRTHLNSIYKKLELDSRVGLALYSDHQRRGVH